ncbi:anaphase promoting complex subunit 11, partial [Ascoidea rubescens DSM 1968]
MKVKIKNWHAISYWHWTVDDELCGICRAAFDSTCPVCKYPGDECPMVLGNCHHAFHLHCILKWLDTETSNGLCPMCRQTFQ